MRAKLSFEHHPVNLMGQLVQRMLVIQNLIKVGLKQLQLVLGWLRLHKSPGIGLIFHDPGDFIPHTFQRRTPQINGLEAFSGTTTYDSPDGNEHAPYPFNIYAPFLTSQFKFS